MHRYHWFKSNRCGFRAREVKPCRLKIFFEKFSEVESPQSGSTLDNIRLICANVNKLIMVLKLFFVHLSRWVQRVKTKHRLRFDSGKRAVETKLLKLVLFIVDGIGTINL